jgi:AP-3 complex subunit beta
MAVAQLLYYIAPTSQLSVVPRALVRLLRGPNEVQYVVLINIATICTTRNNMVDNDVFAISKVCPFFSIIIKIYKRVKV